MDPLSPLFPLFPLGIALVTSFAITKKFGAPSSQGRFGSIDGLRGYLAFFVFMCHSAVWYRYLHTGQWQVPSSHLYAHFGESSVKIFFMITAFLFYTKLLDSKTRDIDWLRFFVARLVRLSPLYLTAVFFISLIVVVLSKGMLHEPIWRVALELFRWLIFGVLGSPDINSIRDTWIIIAGVTWSLTYEWCFYLALPLFAVALRLRAPPRYIAIALIGIALAAIRRLEVDHLLSFAGGIASAYAVRYEAFRRLAQTKAASVCVVICLIVVVALYGHADGVPQVLLLSVAFVLVAAGCSLFGILCTQTSRAFGETAYSMYLIHGIVLFSVFKLVLGTERVVDLSPTGYWTLISCITPLLVAICFAAFKFIEAPAMKKANGMTAWLRSRFGNTKTSEGRSLI